MRWVAAEQGTGPGGSAQPTPPAPPEQSLAAAVPDARCLKPFAVALYLQMLFFKKVLQGGRMQAVRVQHGYPSRLDGRSPAQLALVLLRLHDLRLSPSMYCTFIFITLSALTAGRRFTSTAGGPARLLSASTRMAATCSHSLGLSWCMQEDEKLLRRLLAKVRQQAEQVRWVGRRWAPAAVSPCGPP